MPLDPDLQEFTTASQVLASYDYFDISDGTTIRNFYLSQSSDTGGTDYHLTTDNTTYSGNITERSEANGGALFVKVSDLDYDITFNIPKEIKGKAICSITQGVYNLTSDNTVRVYLVLSLYHVESNGTTEVLLGTATTNTTEVTIGTLDWTSKTQNVEFDVAQTHFAEGEILRFSIEHWSWINGTPNKATGYGVDPQDRNDPGGSTDAAQVIIKDEDTTQAKLAVPFIIDI